MDILTVDVQEKEILGLNDDLREEFPEGGMTCRVQSCPDSRHFSSLSTYRKHWRKYHAQYVTLFKCPLCNLQELEKRNVTHHLQKKHKSQLSSNITSTKAVNKLFVNPGDILPPKKSQAKLLENLFKEDSVCVPRDCDSQLEILPDGSTIFSVI